MIFRKKKSYLLPRQTSDLKRIYRRFKSNWKAWYSFWFLVFFSSVVIAGVYIFKIDPYTQKTYEFFVSPSFKFSFSKGFSDLVLGSDELGRDVFARLLHGAKNTFAYSAAATILAILIGGFIGFGIALHKCWLSSLIKSIVEALVPYTSVLIAFSVVTVLSPSLKNCASAVSAALTIKFIQTAVMLTQDELKKEYVRSILLEGIGINRTFRIAIWPNIRPKIFTQSVKAFSIAVMDITALGFLGLCVTGVEPELGAMIAANMDMMYTGNFSMSLYAGLAIILPVTAVNIVGDGLRNAMGWEED